jgi:ornithine decarboxylase
MTPLAYAEAMERCEPRSCGAVTVDIVDVGGGFPSSIPVWNRRRSKPISKRSTARFEDLPISYSAELWCEPGRALSAEYSSLIVKVEKRRDIRIVHQRRRLWRAV